MRFLFGFLLGLILGFVGYALLEPLRREEMRRRLEAIWAEREIASLPLREASARLGRKVQEAWQEAQRVGREMEEEVVQRYQRLRQRVRRGEG